MNISKSITILGFLLLSAFYVSAQSPKNNVEYHFKKGEVLDILLLSNGSDVASLFPRYRETAFPVASKFSFKPVPGFSISETIQGGVQPESMIFGKWDSLQKRKEFLNAIVPAVPDFHKQRRALWTYFTLTFYEIQKDTHFAVNRGKYNVVTSYWGSGNTFLKYINEFRKATEQEGGKEILTLTNGYSPVGYVYNPSYLLITQWESKEAFEIFYSKHQAMEETSITDVHQFVLD